MTTWLATLLGILVGAALAWLALRARAAQRRAADQAEVATLRERAETLTARLAEVAGQIGHVEQREQRAQADLLAEARLRAAADEKAQQMPPLQARLAEREAQLAALAEEAAARRAQLADSEARLQDERRAAGEKLALLADAQRQLGDAFKALSADALKHNNQSFIDLAQATFARFQDSAKGDLEIRQQAIAALVKPLGETVGKLDGRLGDLEKVRASEAGTLAEQLKQLNTANDRLGRETRNLVDALRRPTARGRWGEIQLRRVVEMAGMIEHCDFVEQANVMTDDGALRPDMVVRLPGGRSVVVDAKAVLSAYLEAIEAPDEESRLDRQRAHARQLSDHIDKLAAKSYWQQFQPAPEFVILFVPGESVLAAACEQRPDLMEHATTRRVILATPSSLIATLLAVAYGWRQEQVAHNAQQISELGRELHERLRLLVDHFAAVGDGLDKAVRGYNKAVGSFETRVLVSARRFKELGVSGAEELPPLTISDAAVRALETGGAA